RRKRRQDAGEQPSMSMPLRQALLAQYAAHKSWSAQLHHDNLLALAETRSELRPVPSYATVRRFLQSHGLTKRRPLTTRQTDGALAAEARLEAREVRGYEAEYVNGLWHWDCHFGSRKVLTPRGEWRTPILFGVLDDCSRLACHLQWYTPNPWEPEKTPCETGGTGFYERHDSTWFPGQRIAPRPDRAGSGRIGRPSSCPAGERAGVAGRWHELRSRREGAVAG